AHHSLKNLDQKLPLVRFAHSRRTALTPFARILSLTAPRQPHTSPTDSLRSGFAFTSLIPRAFSGLRPDSSRATAVSEAFSMADGHSQLPNSRSHNPRRRMARPEVLDRIQDAEREADEILDEAKREREERIAEARE